MKKIALIALVMLMGCQNNQPVPQQTTPPAPTTEAVACEYPTLPKLEVRFSPNGEATELVVEHLGKAQSRILVQAYSFTSVPIAEALIAAKNRGVAVKVIVDKSQQTARGTVVPLLTEKGVTVYVDSKHAIAHNKIIIVDNLKVFTGSFNFTNAAEHNNAENILLITDPGMNLKYWNNWLAHKEHALILNQ